MKVISFEMWVRAPSQEEKCDGIIYDVERTKWRWILERRKPKQAQGERQPGPTEISGTAKQSRRKNLTLTSTIHAEASLPFHHQNTRKTVEHIRDAKNMNPDDSQPEGKVRNLSLIFLCENFHTASTIPLKVGTHLTGATGFKVLQCFSPTFCSVLHSIIRCSATTYALGKTILML